MSIQEKSQLKQNIMKLSQDKIPGVIRIIKDTIDLSNSQENLEFDIDGLPPRKCRELEQYVRRNMGNSKKSNKKKKNFKKASKSRNLIHFSHLQFLSK